MYSNKIQQLMQESGIFLTLNEIAGLEITDFGLNDFENIGLIIHTYINSERCCAKELFLLPQQTCPEHRHPPFGDNPGKEETFRCRFGRVSLFVAGEASTNPSVLPPENGRDYYQVGREYVLNKGDQITLQPNTLHWFKAHEQGAVISEFSTHSDDSSDIFTDPRINRLTYL